MSEAQRVQAQANDAEKLPPMRERMSDTEIDRDILVLAGRLQWYALAVVPQSEFVAQKALRRYGLRTFVPIRTVYRHRSRHARMSRQPKQRICLPVARSYVFAGFEPGEPLWFNLFKDVPNVRGVVHVRGRPLRIPGKDMQTLIRSTASGMDAPDVERFMRTHHEFKAGDSVRVAAISPFEGWTVPVVSIKDGFAEIAVELFGSVRHVEMPLYDLEAV